MLGRVVLTFAEGVAEVRLDRPDKLNALDPPMFAALVEAGERLKRLHGLRAAVLHGAGRGFSAGLNMVKFRGDRRWAPRRDSRPTSKRAPTA